MALSSKSRLESPDLMHRVHLCWYGWDSVQSGSLAGVLRKFDSATDANSRSTTGSEKFCKHQGSEESSDLARHS